MNDVQILGKYFKLKFFLSFGHSMKIIIIIEVDFLLNCNKKIININLIITPLYHFKRGGLDGKCNRLSPFNARSKLC
jgi:hypothetical protein